jgi:hypothetical protein
MIDTFTAHICCTYTLCENRFLERDIVVADRVFNIDSITTASMGQFAVLNTEQVLLENACSTVYIVCIHVLLRIV